jgi:hypothetical protein
MYNQNANPIRKADTQKENVPINDFFLRLNNFFLPYFLPIIAAKTSEINNTDSPRIAITCGKK